jgi:hypothetical protein
MFSGVQRRQLFTNRYRHFEFISLRQSTFQQIAVAAFGIEL